MSAMVIARPTSTALTTIENVRLDLGDVAAGATDAQLAFFIRAASEIIASQAGRSLFAGSPTFGRFTFRESFRALAGGLGDETGGLRLDHFPVGRIIAVRVDGELIPADAYETEGRALYRIETGQRLYWSASAVIVEYEAGYVLPGESRGEPPTTAPDLPITVETRVIAAVKQSIFDSRRDPRVASESVQGVGSTTYVGGRAAGRTSAGIIESAPDGADSGSGDSDGGGDE